MRPINPNVIYFRNNFYDKMACAPRLRCIHDNNIVFCNNILGRVRTTATGKRHERKYFRNSPARIAVAEVRKREKKIAHYSTNPLSRSLDCFESFRRRRYDVDGARVCSTARDRVTRSKNITSKEVLKLRHFGPLWAPTRRGGGGPER